MLPLYILALLAYTTSAVELDFPCKDGEEIRSQLIKSADDMIGNWTYIYHWDNINNFDAIFFGNPNHVLMMCPDIEILPADPEFIKERREQCDNENVPFNWEDAKVRLTAPLMNNKDRIIFMGEKENWLMVNCKTAYRVESRKVSEDLILIINPDMVQSSELMSRKPVRLSELNCLARNVDVVKSLKGTPLCQ